LQFPVLPQRRPALFQPGGVVGFAPVAASGYFENGMMRGPWGAMFANDCPIGA